ncbi:MAG: hypothetical protein LBB62_02530, partial [Proteiniphilum sp.]|nr:hypothetical protein [Proteiniphilum sp.]
MNKKIFTLLAISLMLFTTAFTVDAQVWWSNLSRWYGNPVKNVPVVKKGEKGEKVGAYQLVVTSKGPHAVTGTQDSILLRNGRPFYALAMDEDGYLVLVDSTYLYPPLIGLGAVTDPRERYARLRESLWCAKVQEDEQEDLGLRPGFRFINREYATPLAVSNKGPWINHPGNEIGPYQTQQNECNVDDEAILVGGNLESWDFNSWTYSGSVEDSAYLRIQVGNATDDRFLTLISDGTFRNGRPAIKLAKVSGKAFIPTDPITGNVNAFYRDTLVRFTLSSAAPRVLTKEDINTRLWTRTLDEAENNPGINLQFDPAPTLGENVFAKTVVAEDPTGEVKNGSVSILRGTAAERTRLNYVRLKVLNDASGSDKYITVLDGSNAENYYNNSNNHLFPKIVAGSYTQGTSDFRFIYYPSEDSVAVNLFSITSKEKGFAADNGKYGPVPGPSQTTDLYNWEIWNNLILRLQDLDTRDQTVLTVRDIPNGLRMHFGVAGCEIDDHRATVETDLYIIRDSTGRVLCVPLWAGDMTPRWVAMEANEDPHYMPSCHWLVMKVNEQNPVSRVHFVNREFDRVILEYIQVYDTLARFNANWRICYQLNEYYPAVDTDEAWISTGERFFEKVIDTEKEKFRTDPYLGYKHLSAADLLAIRGYSFRYLHNFTSEPGAKQLYLGVGETNKTKTDTALYVLNDRTFFELSMEPNLLSLPDSTEKYGIGWVDNDDFVQLLSFVQFDLSTHQNTKDIARLERSYYRLRINDYFKYRWNDNYLVLEENGSNARYVYTPEEWAIPRRLGPSKFYLRSTYQTTNGEKPVEYYALLDRIDDRDFDYLTQITGLTLTNVNAWGIDRSHAIVNISLNPAAAQEWGLGVLKMAVDENSGRVRAEVKATTPRVSTFEIQSINEPIYRRF